MTVFLGLANDDETPEPVLTQPRFDPGAGLLACGIGLMGAHRTGKTTIAAKIADVNEFTFVQSSASQLAFEYGIDLSRPMSFEYRMVWQELLFGRYKALYEEQDGTFISDRTPFDLLSYTLAAVPSDEITPAMAAQVLDYAARCYKLFNERFLCGVLIQPGLPYIAEEGKPPFNTAYQEQLNTLLLGMIYDERNDRPCRVLKRDNLDLVTRINAISTFAGEWMITLNNSSRALASC